MIHAERRIRSKVAGSAFGMLESGGAVANGGILLRTGLGASGAAGVCWPIVSGLDWVAANKKAR